MKKTFIYSILAVLAFTGCQMEQDVFVSEEPEAAIQDAKVFTATIEDDFNGATKTSLDGSGNVLWKIGDQVSIFAASTVNEHYQVSDASDGKTAATLNKIPSGGFVAGTDIDNNVAFYPYASTASIAKSAGNYVISGIELPATQNYAAGSFGNGAFPMAAVTTSTEDMNLKFKNVLGGLKLQLKGTATITSITVTGNNNEILYGDAEVTVANGSTPSISLSNASAKTVTLNCGAGVALDSEIATAFIIALPPMTMTGGFTVVVTDTESKQMEITTSKSQTIPRSNLLKMPAVNYVGTAQAAPLKFTSTGSTSISLTKTGTPDPVSLEYKVDDGEWTSYTVGNAIDLTNGQVLSFRAEASGNSSFSQSYGNCYTFSITGEGTAAASGSIMSLLNREGGLTIPNSYCFFSLFLNCSKLTTAPELPATTMAEDCYASMFRNCSSLINAPALPATTLSEDCYDHMFSGCTSLETAPELSAATLAYGCYGSMFSGCTGLTTAPELPATTLADFCYIDMFNGCTSLATAPELPATTLVEWCYHIMFAGCTSLTSPPSLPAITLAEGCYANMFYGCSSLTTAPELPATTLVDACYEKMFSGCTKLNYIKALFTTTPSTSYTDNWVTNVSASGTFVKSGSASWDVVGENGVPSGWTVLSAVHTPEVVDLGLASGVKWASFNIGASAPEEYGDYYAWGEIEPYYLLGHAQDKPCNDWRDGKSAGYDWPSYKWCNGTETSQTKYNTNISYGSVDNKTELDSQDDVAHVLFGGNWRMPTDADWAELMNNCSWAWTNKNGVNGYSFESTINGNSIFLPAAGSRNYTSLDNVGSYGSYWSSSLCTDFPDHTKYFDLEFGSGNVYRSTTCRCDGLSVRPVTE